MDWTTIFKCILTCCPDSQLYVAVSTVCTQGAKAAKQTKDIISAKFVATDKFNDGGQQTYLIKSGLLHGPFVRRCNNTFETTHYRYGRPV